MALINPLMVKNFDGVNSVYLTPPSGKSLRVVDIVLNGLTQDVIIKIEKTYVGFIKAGLNLLRDDGSTAINSQYGMASLIGQRETLMRRLQKRGIPMVYPVAEGETFILEGLNPTLTGYIQYQEYDAGDVKNTEVNGSASDHYIFINYGRPSKSVTPGNYVDIDYPLTPTPFPDFPFGAAVPAGKKILMHGLLIVAWAYNSYTGDADHMSCIGKIKMIKDTECLFDRDMLGIPVFSGAATTGFENYVVYPNSSMFPYGFTGDNLDLGLFATPLEFDEGSVVHAQAYIEDVTNGDTIPLTIPYLGIIEEVMTK